MSATIAAEDRPEGAVVKVRVAPGASRSRLVGALGDALKVSVQAPPERGKANRAVAEVLAAALDLAPRDVEVVAGEAARDKRVLLRGLSAAEARARIARCLPA